MKGNKGEWSELYTLLKLLNDKTLSIGDKDLNKIPDLLYPIIKILRVEGDENFSYSVGSEIQIEKDNKVINTIPISEFKRQAEYLLNEIRNNSKTFELPEMDSFLSDIKCSTLKAKSSSKTDIRIVVHDIKTNTQPELGFSIKSQLGRPSTLLNSSKSTNFTYKIIGNIDDSNLFSINKIIGSSKVRNRILEITKNNEIIFDGIEKNVFRNNLVLIDSLLPEIMAEILKQYYSSDLSSIEELVDKIKDINPINYDNNADHIFYEYKIKKFLIEIAVGMMPATVWSGKYDATGGYLVVKEDGDILAYHLYNRNEFEDYLFHNTRLETPSTSRHGFGEILKKGSNYYINLNLQIRFNK